MSRPTRRARAAPWGWALSGALLGACLVALWHAPARWLASALDQASAGHLQLVQTQGSVWRGSARLQLTGGPGSHDRSALPGRLYWRLSPRPNGLHIRLQAACCTAEGPLQLQLRPLWGGAQLQLQDSRSRWPAALLTGLGTPFNTIQPEGELSLHTQSLHVRWLERRVHLEGQAELSARHISSRLSSLQPLGSYRLRVQGGSNVTVQLDTLDGALQLSGNGQWLGGRLRFQGLAEAAPEHQDALANLLNILGQRRGDQAIILFN